MPDEKMNSRPLPGSLGGHVTKAQLVIIVMIVLVLSACCLFVRSLKSQLYEQRTYSLAQTTEKIVQVMDTVINNEWDRLLYASHELSRTPAVTKEGLLTRLSDFYNINQLLNSWKLACIDENGNAYRWDGRVDRWPIPAMLLNNAPEYQITIVEARDTDAEQMVFLYRLPTPIRLTTENVVLTHTLLSLDMVTFGETLEVTAFEDSSYSYITEKNGTRIYHQQNQSEFIAAYNIQTALEKSAFLYDSSYEGLESAISTGTPYAAEIEREGERFFMSYAPLSVNDWSMYLFVPEAYVGGNTANFAVSLIWQVGAIALLTILMISAYVWTNSKQTLARQQIAVDEARSASQAKTDFLSHMSHDIRTPLNGIMGMCHIAKQRAQSGGEVVDCLDKIDVSSRQLMALINDVLDMSRMEQGKVDVNPVPVDLNELMTACAVHIEVEVEESGTIFEKSTEGITHPIVMADPVLMEKILTNLLGNAAKFTPPGGRISLRATETEKAPGEGLYQFEIEDSGVGMSPEFLEHMFEPFSQERDGGRTKYQGTGLGLSIVKTLVDRLGGTILVQSAVGQGSTFTISLPLPYLREAETAPTEEVTQSFHGTGQRVLLVEDNEINREIAKTIMEDCGLVVDTAGDGAEAVACFQRSVENMYDLIVMDVRMPVMDGLEASRLIRTLKRADAKTVPIVALTADALVGDVEKTRKAGMNDYLRKPIELDRLYGVLNKFCPGVNQAKDSNEE